MSPATVRLLICLARAIERPADLHDVVRPIGPMIPCLDFDYQGASYRLYDRDGEIECSEHVGEERIETGRSRELAELVRLVDMREAA